MMLEEFLQIAVVGALLSVAFEMLHKRFNLSKQGSKLAVIGLSLIVGTVYYFLVDTVYWQAVTGILMASSTVYALLLNK